MPQYFIVAAGIVHDPNAPPNPEHAPPVYNDLQIVDRPRATDVVVWFAGYDVWFNEEHKARQSQLIVKALPVLNRELDRGSIVVNFLQFTEKGILLRVTNLQDEKVNAIELMIEISKFYGKVGMVVPNRPIVNLNTATLDELQTLHRVGPEMAKRILAKRRATRGGFKSLDDLTSIEGVGPALVGVIAPFVTLKTE